MGNRSKVLGALSYITWIGFVVAIVLRDKNDLLVKQHINQAAILNLIAIISLYLTSYDFPLKFIGIMLDSFSLIFSLVGIVRALRVEEKPLPIIGKIRFIK